MQEEWEYEESTFKIVDFEFMSSIDQEQFTFVNSKTAANPLKFVLILNDRISKNTQQT
ncbi:hypothetical protein KIN20_031743 [Parelaphostrongylus tenuis]|uniref:Uncharacterized protein n=1 Tax=Parelaphostrongylus tenuis TaxID=148309 RepID=A0AAD5R5I5_PARTN|nr:hypothetical protein KIN20_031743 [Parelaphostrongylus tenuis]